MPSIEVDYTSNLLGTIRSHLEGLQGYDVMALELIQNADDAEAQEIIFDITNKGLMVWNSGEFTYCGQLNQRPCPYLESEEYACDFHRIIEVASGGKLARAENIGRFGIGFVSTYQITDHPEIHSAGLQVTLQPEKGKATSNSIPIVKGTHFVLPWASNPSSPARNALSISHVTLDHIDQLSKDFEKVLRQSLFFLRHIHKAELRRNGELIFGCQLDHNNKSESQESELMVTFHPSKLVELWYVLRTKPTDKDLNSIYIKYAKLKDLKRKYSVSIAFRTEPNSLEKGYLYAYLPTEQPTGLPLHINADFFPEADRKRVIFDGQQHQQAWNEMLVETAAFKLAEDLEKLRDKLGYKKLWDVISQALTITKSNFQPFPACFKKFWLELKKAVGSGSQVVLTAEGKFECTTNAFFPRQPLGEDQLKVLSELGIITINEDLRPYQNTLLELESKILNYERLIDLMDASLPPLPEESKPVSAERLANFYLPLWRIIDNLLPDLITQNMIFQKLKKLPIIVDWEMYPTLIDSCYTISQSLQTEKIAEIFPHLWFAHESLRSTHRIFSLIDPLTLENVTHQIEDDIENIKNINKSRLKALYRLLADLDMLMENDEDAYDEDIYERLRSLPIWLTGKGLIPANHALLSGKFTDPTGQANLIDPELLDPIALEFVQSKLGIQSQTIETYVRTFVPQFFINISSVDLVIYQRLITELANHLILVDDDKLRNLLAGLRIVPTRAGEWARPSDTYYHTKELVSTLGDNKNLWIDESRLPSERSVKSFLENIGIRKVPSAEHLIERICQLAHAYKPNDDAKKASERAFYALCRQYRYHKDEWKSNNAILQALSQLKTTNCLPADGDQQTWYKPSSLHVFYRSEGFWSQAKILAFRDARQIDNDLLKEIEVLMEPSAEMVVNHLLYCVKNNEPAHETVYQILSEHCGAPAIRQLVNKPCIYLSGSGLKRYVRPNQLYWSRQDLGKYAFTIPDSLEKYKLLFNNLGIKNQPTPKDYIDILIDVVSELPIKAIEGSNRAVYNTCLRGIADAEESELNEDDWKRLKESQAILNLSGYPCYPDDILLNNSDWHAQFFQDDLSDSLCKFDLEYWPLLERLGVEKLSKRAQIKLEYFEGHEITEEEISNKLRERERIVAMLLQDKFVSVRQAILEPLKTITSSSYDTVRIQATVQISNGSCSARPVSVAAFYDQAKNNIILKRPINKQVWVHIFNALLHQLVPNEAASEISKLASHLALLMHLSIEEAIDQLSAAGIQPLIDEKAESIDQEEINVGGLGGESDTSGGDTGKTPGGGDTGKTPGGGDTGKTPGGGDAGKDKLRIGKKDKHKRKRDEQLISIVRELKEQGDTMTDSDMQRTHNLAVEAAARKIVCEYERARNRNPEEMSQTHPGYDIISRDPSTNDILRYIEVKGIDGEWNKTGVGLSRTQFCNAQEEGNNYWLYVVEHALDPNNYRIYPIQSPASKVGKFMYDSGWRGVVSDEPVDPTAGFVSGAKVDCGPFGRGTIIELRPRRECLFMVVDLFIHGKRELRFSPDLMKLID